MVKVVAHTPGAFCFVESGSANIELSNRFYEGLFGWEVDNRSLSDDGSYTRFLMRGQPVAGIYGVGAKEDAVRIPSQWLSYVSVQNAVATLEKARKLGATPFGDVVEVPGVVTVAEFVDPEGVICGLWQPGTHIGTNYLGEPGTLTWTDLLTSDLASATSFYCDVFGWTSETTELPSGTFHFFKSGDTLRAGASMTSATTGQASPSWRAHIGVGDLNAARAKIIDLGGLTEGEAIRVPGLGRRAAVKDPTGISFMLIETAQHHLNHRRT
jgi:predicted enzyme related to lactoylglutathione lyase